MHVAVLRLALSLFSVFSVYIGVVGGVVTERNSSALSALSVSDESRERTSITPDRFALLREAFSALQMRMKKNFAEFPAASRS